MKVDLLFYNEFCGGDLKIPAAQFPRWECIAERELAVITGGKSDTSKLNSIKVAICEMAEILYEKAKRGEILTENNDGYSVSYKNTNVKNALMDAAKRHLYGTDLLYRGVCNEN